MRKVLVFLTAVAAINCYSQFYDQYIINFEDTSQLFRVIIDTVNYPNNLWQIGEPQKAVFNSAHSVPNAIITDLNHTYPVNNTSVFTIRHISTYAFCWGVIISGYYKIDSDTLNDCGFIEYSPDNGETWIDIINDTYYSQFCNWYTPKPVLTGRTHEWTHFYADISELGNIFGVSWYDTVYYRFSFISDQQSEEMEGLIFDDLYFEDWWEGINENSSGTFESSAYPVPSSSILNIDFDNKDYQSFGFEIFSKTGQCVFSKQNIFENSFTVRVNDFVNGMYFYKLTGTETKQVSTGKILIIK